MTYLPPVLKRLETLIRANEVDGVSCNQIEDGLHITDRNAGLMSLSAELANTTDILLALAVTPQLPLEVQDDVRKYLDKFANQYKLILLTHIFSDTNTVQFAFATCFLGRQNETELRRVFTHEETKLAQFYNKHMDEINDWLQGLE